MAGATHPEVTAKLDRKRRCIVITVAGDSRTASFKAFDEPASLWSEKSPCPAWAQAAVRAWSETPAGAGLFRDLAALAPQPSPDDVPTAVERNKQ
jgi:hypothetical protein